MLIINNINTCQGSIDKNISLWLITMRGGGGGGDTLPINVKQIIDVIITQMCVYSQSQSN